MTSCTIQGRGFKCYIFDVFPYIEFAEEVLLTHPNLYTAEQTHKICIAVINTILIKREEGKKEERKMKRGRKKTMV